MAGGNEKLTELMHGMARFINEHADQKLDLPTLAAEAQMSPGHFQKLFKAALGVTPKAYQETCRQQRLKRSLRDGSSVTEAIYAAGYGSSSRVYEKVDRSLAMTPGAYRRGARGESISYAFAETELGLAMIAATDRGICFLQFAENQTDLLAYLGSEYPNADIVEMSSKQCGMFEQWISSLNAYLRGRISTLALPLDIQGTAFQKLVWDYLQTIPAGTVKSYTEVAAAIGKPKAVRAVASACARNRIAISIPCHRVLRGDGSLAGYRWGLTRKRALIELERQSEKK